MTGYFDRHRSTRRARRRRRVRRRIYGMLVRLVLAWVLVTVAVVLVLRWVNPPTTAFMIAAQARGEEAVMEWLDWSRIPPELALAVVASEDQRFPRHFGFDFVEIQDAVETAIEGGRVRGASTISQQVAKNLFLWSGRSFVRKGLEAYFTVLLEILWPKSRILEVYLNIAQFGDGFYGVAAASREYFGKTPDELTRYEMSLLAPVLPDPVDLNPAAPGEFLVERAAFVRKHMDQLGGVAYLEGM